jgi:hypothetical protein
MIKDIVIGEVLGDHIADKMTKVLVMKTIPGMLVRHEIADGYIFHIDMV